MNINTARIALINMILLIFGLILVIGLGIAGYVALHTIAKRAPSQAATITLVPKPPPRPLCPGEHIPYTFGATPLHVPVVARISTTVWSFDKGETVIEQRVGSQELRIWSTPGQITNEETYLIPHTDRYGRPMTPGQYEIRHAIVAEGFLPATFSLQFEIDEECEIAEPDAGGLGTVE